MRKQKISFVNILQLVVLTGILIFVVVLLAGRRDSSTPYSEVKKQVVKAIGKETALKEGGSAVWKRYYGLNPKEFEGAVLLYSEGVMEVDEILLVKAKDESQAGSVEKAVRERLSVQKKNFEGYGAEQTKLLKNAVVETRGTYIFMAVSKDAGKYQQAFKESL